MKRGEYPPKEAWGPGPWQEEPDRAEWTTRAGYKAYAVRGPMGSWCGYVIIPPDHPWFGKEYTWCVEGCPEQPERKTELYIASSPRMRELLRNLDRFRCEHYDHHIEQKLSVHGGITWSGDPYNLRDCPAELGEWGFGFDCAHAFDFLPAMNALMKDIAPDLDRSHHDRDVYVPLDYVQIECERLAQQLVEVVVGISEPTITVEEG